MLSEHGKGTPSIEKTATDTSEPGKVTEAQLQEKPGSPTVLSKAAVRPRSYSTGIIPGQFGGGRPLSSPIPMRMPSDEILSRLQGDSSINLNIGLILSQAISTFPYRTQKRELCRHVIPKMMPLYYEAVRKGKIRADVIFREGKGGMADVLYLFLRCNDEGPQYGALSDSLSREGSQIWEEVRQSDEWLALRKAILDADEQWRKPAVQLALTKAKNLKGWQTSQR